MKTNFKRWCALAAAGLAFSLQPSAFASLSGIITPGYQFPTDGSVPPTYQLLNLLAEPTIQIVGTIGGSNTLAPGSVTGVSLSDNLPDGVTIGWNGNSPRQLQVLVPGLTNINDLNLSPTGAVEEARLLIPSNSIPVGADTNAGVTLVLNPQFNMTPSLNVFPGAPGYGPSLGLTNYGKTLSLSQYTNIYAFPSAAGAAMQSAHGWTNTPAVVLWKAVCTNAEQGYSVGDEVDLIEFIYIQGAANEGSVFGFGGNSTNVWFQRNAPISAGGSPSLPNKGTGT